MNATAYLGESTRECTMARRDPFRDKVHASFLASLEKGITQAKICRATGIDRSSMSQFKDKKILGPEKLAALSTWLKRNGFMTASMMVAVPDRPKPGPYPLPKQMSFIARDSGAPYPATAQAATITIDFPCHECGELVVGPASGAICCYKCGAAFFAACPTCGHGNRIDARFCNSCGMQLLE